MKQNKINWKREVNILTASRTLDTSITAAITTTNIKNNNDDNVDKRKKDECKIIKRNKVK